MELQHIPCVKNRADPLTVRSYKENQIHVHSIEEEEENLVNRLRVWEEASQEEIEVGINEVFRRLKNQDQIAISYQLFGTRQTIGLEMKTQSYSIAVNPSQESDQD